MKAIKFACLMLLAFYFQSCHSDCSCSKWCVYYDHDSIEICQNMPVTSPTFAKLNDSLTQIYGAGRDTTISIGNLKSSGSVMNQLEHEGYQCDCPK